MIGFHLNFSPFLAQIVSIKIEKDDDQFTKNDSSESVSKAHNSDNEENDLKPPRSRSPSQTWASSHQPIFGLNCKTTPTSNKFPLFE